MRSLEAHVRTPLDNIVASASLWRFIELGVGRSTIVGQVILGSAPGMFEGQGYVRQDEHRASKSPELLQYV